MTGTTRTVLVAAVLALAVSTGVALASPATTTTTTDAQTNETASVSAPDQQFDGENLTIESATLPDGGFAVVYNQSKARIGHTEYLSAGDYQNVTVSLNETVEDPQVLVVALVHNNGSESYNASADKVAYENDRGKEVADVSYVYFQTRGQETTTAETTTESTSEETTTDASSGSIPGFTPITGVVALLGAAFLGLRRS
ncbi:PGF-CTERM sorting domain-containing protein [Halorussus sp. MSC15.2]|uniref:DUF7282 domain-containing protein n=1 Tax=Halorussus sp. MSC15.2 TaxID=2283638 RepID=UPI0013D6A12D|nr:PGF-CTERM sorting domain-containing protein [Halorussus sp. MSC15.2]NEU56290.1 PGF-CTERM sorting domain-containing protein [Halorussus sp. MSC15.2]